MSSDLTNTQEPAPDVASPAPVAAPSEESPWQAITTRLRRGEVGQLPVILMLLVIVAVFSFTSGGKFLLPINLNNLVLQQAPVTMIALAAVLVLLLAEIDLSSSAVAYLAGGVMTILSALHQWPAGLALLAGLGVSLLIGLLNGFFVAVLRIPSFIVTLAGFIFYAGLLLFFESPNTSIGLYDPALRGIMSGYVIFPWDVLSPIPFILIYAGALWYERSRKQKLGLRVGPAWTMWLKVIVVVVLAAVSVAIFEFALGAPYSFYITLGILTIVWLVLRFTTYGRHVYAVGGSPEAARRAGINVTAIRISIFAISSTLAGFGGIMLTSEIGAAVTGLDPNLLLLAIAVAVIGGVSLFGGRGSVWGVLLGVLTIGSLTNGLALFTAGNAALQQMLEGAVLIAAVVLDAVVRRNSAVSGR